MRHFHRLAACAATAVIALGTLSGTPASANEAFATRADPAVSYKFGPFVRRGVEMTENGVLTVRSDGCWRSLVEVMNASGRERSVSVVMRVADGRGRTVSNLVVIDNETLANADVVKTEAHGCDSALARNFPPRPHSVKRIFSVH